MKLNVQDLIDKGLVTAKEYPNGLKVLRYAREVFYKSLWGTDLRLLQCRGHVVDQDWNLVVRPFDKVFNFLEQGAGSELHPECLVRIVTKVNGFLGCVTNTAKHGVIYSTTGTLDSDFAKLAGDHITRTVFPRNLPMGITFMFEVCDKSDPHIVDEQHELYFIGARNVASGHSFTEHQLDLMAEVYGWHRPSHILAPLNKVLGWLGTVKHEGFMIKNPCTEEVHFKGKSSHYLSKKLLMRLGNKRVDSMYNNPEEFKTFVKDEEFFSFVDHVVAVYGLDEWKGYSDQERREIIEKFMSEENYMACDNKPMQVEE